MEGGERMIETYAETIENMIKEEMQKKLSDMITKNEKLKEKNEKLKEKNEYLQKEVEDAKAVGERALCEVQELIAKNKRLVEEHNRQNGTIQALNIALDVITDRYSNLRKKLCRTGKGGE
jgi:hypothetical protein